MKEDTNMANKKPMFMAISIEELKRPKTGGGYWLYRNLWWIVNDDDEAVVYVTFSRKGQEYYKPQGNLSKKITESILKQLSKKEDFPGTKIAHIEHAFLPHPEYYYD